MMPFGIHQFRWTHSKPRMALVLTLILLQELAARQMMASAVIQATSTSLPSLFYTHHQTDSRLSSGNPIAPKPSYLVLAGKAIQPGEAFRVAVTLFRNANKRAYNFPFGPYETLPANIQVRIGRKGAVIISEIRECHFGSTELITVTIPDPFYGDGNETSYTLTVEGNIYGGQHGSLFLHQRPLKLLEPDVRIVLESQQPTYTTGQMMQFRAVPLLHSGRRYLEPIDLFLHDPTGTEMARWTARNAVSGPIHVGYHLASETPIGKWRLSANTRSSRRYEQPSRLDVHVVRYEAVGYEVRVWMPRSIVPMDGGLEGWIEAKRLGDGAPVNGRLSLKASLSSRNGVLCEGKIFLSKPSDTEGDEKFHLSLDYGDSDSSIINGRLKWKVSRAEIFDNMCGGISANETELNLEATVTNAENGQLVRAHASTIIYEKSLRMDFSVPSPAVIHLDMPFMAWVWAQRADGRQLSLYELESLTMNLETIIEYRDGSSHAFSPTKLFRRRMPQKQKHLWQVAINLLTMMRNISTVVHEVKNVALVASLSKEGEVVVSSKLLLVPPRTNPHGPQLQITTSTRRPMYGSSIILHVRSNFVLEDFHCVIISMGRLLTTRLISMGNSKLKTFDEIVTLGMAPEATFLVWHVDTWGRTVSASVTVPIFAHDHGKLDAHPVLEGSSGYTQLTLSGEPNSLVLLNAINEDARVRLMYSNDPYDEIAQDSIVSHSNGLSSAANLLILSDFNNGFVDDSKLGCTERGLFQCSKESTKCYSFLKMCDQRCDCTDDCSDELNCGGGERGMQARQSPSSQELIKNDFWQVAKMPANGTLNLRVPFGEVEGRLYSGAVALGSRGLSSLGSRAIKVGTIVKFHMELPSAAKLGEVISIRFSGINHGGLGVRRTFSIYSMAKSFQFLSANGFAMDISSKLISIEILPHSHTVVYVPIKPLDLGQVIVRARSTDDKEAYLMASTNIIREGYELTQSSQMLIDLSNRPYFVDTLHVSVPSGYNSSNVLTLTEGVVGPILTQFPFNITSVLGYPKVTADEAVFVLGQILLYLQSPGHHDQDREIRETLNNAYQRLLVHLRPDGSVAYGLDDPTPSVYLTACALDVLRRLHSSYSWPLVDGFVIAKMLQWLVDQQSEGSFREKYMFDGIYQRKIPVELQEIALTAHVLSSVASLTQEDMGSSKLKTMVQEAASFLAGRLEILDKSGTSLDIALVARALQISNSPGGEAAFEILAKNRHEDGSYSFWGHVDDCDESLSVRSTAVALMIYVDRGEFFTEPIVRWLNKKRTRPSSWGSTVDTLLSTEALVKWSAKYGKTKFKNVNEGVALEVDSSEGRRSIVLDNLNNVITLDSPTKDINVEAKGQGLALVQLTSSFTTTSQTEINKQTKVSAFNLEPRVEMKKLDNEHQLLVLSCQRWNCQKDLSVSGPAVLTMKLPTGFIIDSEELLRVQSKGYIARMQDGMVVIFFHRLTPDFECVNFTLRRLMPVSKISPYIPMEIWDWYAPERRNTSLVFLPDLHSVSICDVCGSSDCPNCEQAHFELDTIYASRAASKEAQFSILSLIIMLLIV